MNFCSLKGYNNETFPSFSVEDKKTGNKCDIYSFTASYYFYIFMSKVHVSLNSYERASWKKKKSKIKNKQNKKHVPPFIWLLLTRERRVTDWQTLKSIRVDATILQSHWTLSSLAVQGKPCWTKMDISP